MPPTFSFRPGKQTKIRFFILCLKFIFFPSKILLYTYDTLLDYIIAQTDGWGLPNKYGVKMISVFPFLYVLIGKEGVARK